jgi:hypothetical protein
MSAAQRAIVAAERIQLAAIAKRTDIPSLGEVNTAIEAEIGAAVLARASTQGTVLDLLSTGDLRYLVGVQRGRFDNVLSEARQKSDPPLPAPVVQARGSQPSQYSYAAIRPFLLAHWPGREAYLPAQFAEVRAILDNRQAQVSRP